jgi:quercetin dioxygenase-like cupin family protein
LKLEKLDNMTGGWFIGDFEPSILRTSAFEVAVHRYKAGDSWPVHTHKKATEYNLLVQGTMVLQEQRLESGTLFVLDPWEVADPKFLTDCLVVIVKVPSVPGDKYELQIKTPT